MRIVKEGVPFTVLPSVAGILLLLGEAFIAGSLLIGLGLFCLFFFRDPHREAVKGENVVIAPADGTVMEVTEEDGKKVVRIFLSVFNVHLQRAPFPGVVKSIAYLPGKFLPAMHKKAHIVNEQNVFTFETSKGDIVVRQIAGILARRVVSWIKPGDIVVPGQKIGFIKFGSQVDILFPASFTTTLETGEKVIAGTTIIAQ